MTARPTRGWIARAGTPGNCRQCRADKLGPLIVRFVGRAGFTVVRPLDGDASDLLCVADFNQDGQLDIITVDQEDMMQNGIHSPRWYAFTQVGGEWKEQVLFDFGLGGHDIQIGDVDGDGDLDLVSKVWNPWKASANQGRSHADFLENLTIDRRTGRD